MARPVVRSGSVLSDAKEKSPYVAKVEMLKAEYTKKIDAYNYP